MRKSQYAKTGGKLEQFILQTARNKSGIALRFDDDRRSCWSRVAFKARYEDRTELHYMKRQKFIN